MKKLFAITMTSLMLVSLCACGNKEPEAAASSDQTTETATVDEAVDTSDEVVDDAEVGMANPWVDATPAEIADMFFLSMNIPEGATDVIYQINNSINMGEAMFNLDGTTFVYRVSYSEEMEDTSGIYTEWDLEDECTIHAQVDDTYTAYEGNKAKFLGCHTDELDYQVIIWYDPVFKRNFCLSAVADDLDGFDIQAYAEQMYYQPDPDTCDMEVFGDGWVTNYDVRDIYCHEDGDEMIFSFYNPLVQTAGSNYAAISTKKGTDYKTVLDEIKANNNDTTTEYLESNFGTSNCPSYSYTIPSSASEGSGLQVIDTFIAIPHGDDVILIETFSTVEPKEEDGYVVAGAFEYLLGSFRVE